MYRHPQGLNRTASLLVWLLVLSAILPFLPGIKGSSVRGQAAPPSPQVDVTFRWDTYGDLDSTTDAVLQPSGIFPDYILGIEVSWESDTLREESLPFTMHVTYPAPETEFFEDGTRKLTWDSTYVDNCTHDPATHTIECTGAFPPTDPIEVLSTNATFYIVGTCNLYPDPPEQLTLSGEVIYPDNVNNNISEVIPVAPRVDLTVLADNPIPDSVDVVIESGGNGPLLQWHDQASGLVCGTFSAPDPEHQDILYAAYLHKPGQPLQAIGDQNGECSRQIQLSPDQLSCDENGNPQEWEWVVAALDMKYAFCSPTPLQENIFRFTTATCRPTVEEIALEYDDKYFLNNVGVENQVDVKVNWNGPAYETPPTPPIDGKVYFEVNGEGKPPDGIAGDVNGASTSFNMGQDFKAGWGGGGNVVKVWAEYRPSPDVPYAASEIKNITPLVFPFPEWATNVNLGPFSVDLQEGVVEYENEAAYPEPAFEASVEVPKAVPYLGGKELGILESQAKASVAASSAGEGKLGLEGQTGLGLGAFEIVGELGGEGQFKFLSGEGLWMEKAKLKLGISTPFKKEMTLADLIPAVKAAEEWWFVGDLIKKVTRSIVVEGSITPKISIEADFKQQGRKEWVFEGSIARGEIELKVTATFKPYEKLWVQVYGGGTPFLEFNLPANPEYFRRMGIQLDFGAKLHAWRWEEEFKYGVTCALPGGCSSDDDRRMVMLGAGDAGWTLMGREYVTPDYDVFQDQNSGLRAGQALAGTATAEAPLVTNVYPLTEPALAVRADGHRTLAYVTDDPGKPLGQGEELVVTQWDGNWTTPMTLTDDLRLDFAPQVAYDGSGNAVVVWERTYTDVLTGGLDLAFTQQIDVAAATWISATGTWSPITMLTEDNGLLDHSPRLRAGDDGSLLALWQTCDGTDILGAPGHPVTYTYATWDGAAWSVPAGAVTGLTRVLQMDVAAYDANTAALAYVVDTDGTLTTTVDTELYYSLYDGSNWATPVRLTDDTGSPVTDTHPALVYNAAGNLQILWLRGDRPVLLDGSLDVSNAGPVQVSDTDGAFHALSLSRSPAGHLALLWQAGMEMNGADADLAYSVYDAGAGRWGFAQYLTGNDAVETALAPAFGDDGTFYLAYRKTATEYVTRTVVLSSTESFTVTNLPQPGRSDLHFLSHSVGRDLSISDVAVDPAYPASGAPVTLTARVHNIGDLEAGPVVVRFDADDGSGATPVATVTVAPTLTAGSAVTATAAWTAPAAITGPYTLHATVDPADAIAEILEDNNTAQATILGPHLVADSASRALSTGALTCTLAFHNAGSSPAQPPITVTLRAGDPDGPILGTTVLTNTIAAGAPASATLTLTDLAVLEGLSSDDGWLVAGDPRADRANAWPTSLAVEPDLVMDGFGQHDTLNIYAWVRNAGPVTATGAALTVWRDVTAASLAYTDTLVHDGTVVFSDTLSTLAPGQAITVDLGLSADYRAELWALADPHDAIAEADETNNLAIRGTPAGGTCYAPEGVSLSGPSAGFTGTAYAFVATLQPPTLTLPVDYTWTPEPGSTWVDGTTGEGQALYDWDAPGTYTVTASAAGCGSAVSDTHTIVIRARMPFEVYLPLLMRQHEPLVIPPNTRYVKRYGSDSGACSTPETACGSIQYAVDVAQAGDLIAIAGYEAAYAYPKDPEGDPRWTYWFTEMRSKPDGYYGPDQVTQVVLVDKSLTLRGGYAPGFDRHDSATYKTVLRPGLDGGAGRGVLIAPFAEVTLEDLIILEGDASGLGGRYDGSGGYLAAGGGVHALGIAYRDDALTIRDCVIAGNVASQYNSGAGGGVYIEARPGALLTGNTLYDNLATVSGDLGEGGGLYARYSDGLRLENNHVYSNAATINSYGQGGGINLADLANPIIQANALDNNSATVEGDRGLGGGLYLNQVTGGSIAGNTIRANRGGGYYIGAGGGLNLYNSNDVTISGNWILGNVAAPAAASAETSGGGGVRISRECLNITLDNNVIAGNQAPFGGGGILVAADNGTQASLTLRHNTLADNGVPEARTRHGVTRSTGVTPEDPHQCRLEVCQLSGDIIESSRADVPREAQAIMTVGDAKVYATNNIIAGHTRGVYELWSGRGTLVFDHTLWHANTTDAVDTVVRTEDRSGDPAFVDAAGGDYHIGAGSAARNAGASAGVPTDIDGQARDGQPDIGADEYW